MINNQLPIILKEIKMDESALGFLISSSALGNLLYSIYRIKLKKDSPLNNKNEFINECCINSYKRFNYIAFVFNTRNRCYFHNFFRAV